MSGRVPAGAVTRLDVGAASPIFLARFHAASFDPARFAADGIVCPASVARSVRKRQAEFFHGRLAARAALEALGGPAHEVAIGAGGEPVWPGRTVGSLSHTDGLAAAVAAAPGRLAGLGLDVEHVASPGRLRALRAVALDEGEAGVLAAGGPAGSMAERVTLAFSAKESLYKAARGTVGRSFGFRAARVAAFDEVRGTLTLVLQEDLHPAFPAGRPLVVRMGRAGATTVWTLLELD